MSQAFETAQKTYNQRAQILIGECIESVAYCEIDYGEPKIDFDLYHDIDHGVQLTMQSGKEFYLMWATQYQNHDLKFGEGSILSQFPDNYPPPLRLMTGHQKWSAYIGSPIIKITSFWPYVQYQNGTVKTRYPQDLRLDFENGQSLIVAAVEIEEDNSMIPMANNVTIFFDVKTALAYGICQ